MDYIGDLIFSLFGNLLKPIGIYSSSYAIQIMLLSWAVGDLLTGLLRLVNFSYWRYFSASRYLLILAGFLLHRNLRVNLQNQPIMTTVLFYMSLSYCCLYLVDFAWSLTEKYYNPKKTEFKILMIIVTLLLAILLTNKMNDGNNTYILYLMAILVAAIAIPAAKTYTGLLVILISLFQKFSNINFTSNFMYCIAIQTILIYIVLDRQGQQAKINYLNAVADWPASSYFIMAAIKIYLYFRITGEIYNTQYVVGLIFIQTAIAASI